MNRKYKPTKRTKTGRTVLSPAEYAALRKRAFAVQDECCFLCRNEVRYESFTLHHHGERGMGGSRHDDRLWYDFDEAVDAAVNQIMLLGYVYGLCMGFGTRQCHESVDKKVLHWTGMFSKRKALPAGKSIDDLFE